MIEKDFIKLCEEELIGLAKRIEDNDQESLFDVEYLDGILTIFVTATNQTYVINKHSASKKIWYSSPVTRTDYFSYDSNQRKWFDDQNQELSQKLISELKTFSK
jgi:frataxin-like iron-binding protein CyaY